MVNQFIQWFESKTGVYLYPRFVISVALLLCSAGIFLVISFFAWNYAKSVETIGPMTEKEKAQYEAKMRAVHLPPTPSAR
ncbi:MAG: hypothetical protein ACEQSB_04245 [Undibacterium sp.]